MILAEDWNRRSQPKLLLMAVRQLHSKALRIMMHLNILDRNWSKVPLGGIM